MARSKCAKSWELRAAMSITALWSSQGKQRQARDILGSIYCWFSKGFDTQGLREANGLLDELGSR
jgi:hypothetical protein